MLAIQSNSARRGASGSFRVRTSKGDVLVEIDGSDARLTESQLMTSLVNAKRPGDKVEVVNLRDGRRMTFKLPMQ